MKIVNIIEIIEMPAATAFGLGAIENEKKTENIRVFNISAMLLD